MRITFLTRSLSYYGGAQRQLVILARGLQERGHSVTVAVFYSGSLLENELRQAGVEVRMLSKGGRWDLFSFLLRLVRLLHAQKPAVLHGYLGVPNILTVLLKPLLPRVGVVWGLRASNIDLERYDWLTRLLARVERRMSRFADLIIVNSYAGRNHAVSHGFSKEKMVVISNGIDTARFCPDPEARQRVRAEWGVSQDEKLIGVVGRLDPMKDHANFLKAAALLSQERDGVRYVCVGDGPVAYRQDLHALGRELGLTECLVWAGMREDTPAIYNALDILASSSCGEGFPNVVGEAMACGVPCVVTDVGDSAWIVGETGIVVPPMNPKALAEGLRTSLNGQHEQADPYSIRMRVTKQFSVQSLVLETERCLTSVARR